MKSRRSPGRQPGSAPARCSIGSRSKSRDPSAAITLDQYFEVWIRRKRATARKQATPYRYNSWYRNHLSQPLGEKRLRDIQVADLHALQAEMTAQGYRASSVNYTMQVLKLILNDALREELIERNPARQVRGLPQTEPQITGTKHRALTEPEQRLFLAAAKRSFYYEFFAFLLLTGMRHGEAAAMTWADVDYDQNVLHVTKTQTFDTEGHVTVGPPKSAAGLRDIPMNDGIRRVLQTQRRKSLAALGDAGTAPRTDMPQTRERESRGAAAQPDSAAIRPDHAVPADQSAKQAGYTVEHAGSTGGLPAHQHVFFPEPHPDRMLHNATANKALQRVLDRLEAEQLAAGEVPMQRFSLHALRDTFATRFIEQGGNPQTLKTILGHRSLAMTMDLYSQVLPNTRQREMDQMRMGV